MKKKWLLSIMLAALMVLALGACHAPLSLADVEKQNRDKWHVTYDLQGGMFSSQAGIDISHYYPKKDGGTYILEPNADNFGVLEIAYPGYFLEGWYKTSECNPADRWKFDKDKITGDTTLYAHWLQNYEFRFMAKNADGQWEPVSSRSVSKGGRLNETNKPTREGYTMLDWYEDEACTILWDTDTRHSGEVVNGTNEASRGVNVYTTWLEGDWAVVKTAIDFTSAVSSNRNIYLYNDIEFGEPSIITKSNWSAFEAEYDKTIEGNGFAVKDVVMVFPDSAAVNEQGRRAYCALFKTLKSGAKLKNVSFENIALGIEPDGLSWDKWAALLACKIEAGVTFEGVSLSGTVSITHGSPINLYNFGLVGGEIASNATLAGLDFTGVTVDYAYTGTGTAYTPTTDAKGLFYFE